MKEEVWKLTEFSSKVGVHYNTVDRWFKTLEEERIHYIERVAGTKIYDDLDLRIAQFIEAKRNEKWELPGIFNSLPDVFELRPFPIDYNGPITNPAIDIERMKTQLLGELVAAATKAASTQFDAHITEFKNLLPDPVQDRLNRMNEASTHRRIERKLKKAAIELWESKPESERKKKVGLFRKEEDINARDRFILDYIDDHYETELEREFAIEQ
ncbi:hypothetical protein D3C74_91770 [compost metagenome]